MIFFLKLVEYLKIWLHDVCKLRYFQQKVKLGQGGFGSVWRAIDRKTNLFVAVKEIDKMKAYWQGAKRSEIQMEIRILRACDHVKLFPEDCKLSF